MSDLWHRCRSDLERRLPAADWHRCIEPLRAWMDAGVLYLWVERDAGDYRSIANPARELESAIRSAFSRAWGREPRAIYFLTRPPNREDGINSRRIRAHRYKTRHQEDLESQKLLEYAKEECRKLYAEAGDYIVCGTADEKFRRVREIVIARAKARLEKEAYGFRSDSSRKKNAT